MKKEYNIKGLDCGNCALTLEKYLEKVDGVKSCTINFSTCKLFLDIDDNSKDVMKAVFKTIKQVNRDVSVSESIDSDNSLRLIDKILYIVGIVLGLFVVFGNLKEWSAVTFYILLVTSGILMGYKTYIKAILQLRHFKINENTLITISIWGAIALGESMEGLMVIALYTLGKMLESKAVNYSRKSISQLISTQPEYAVIEVDGREKRVKPESVKINDIVVIRSGEKVPLDGVIVEGTASIDKSHITGESIPINANVGEVLESGCIVLDSAIKIKVSREYKDSTVSKILNLVSNATNKKSKTETFISKFSSYYTLIVLSLSLLTFGLTTLILNDVSIGVYRGLIFLVVSCPCAFAISVPLSYFSGIGRCSKSGILVKGSNYLDSVAKLNRVIFDKTGTLTTGKFIVSKIKLVSCGSEHELLDVVVAGEKKSIHPIAKAICDYHKDFNPIKIKKYKEIAGKGIEFEIGEDSYFVGKGENISGETLIIVNKNDTLYGKIYLRDEVKEESLATISQLKDLKVKTMMLSGDNNKVTKKVGNLIGVDDSLGELSPEDKYRAIEEIKNDGEKVAFVGDGINDTPALALSDVGISMGIMGTPATIENSDIVIADDNIAKIPKLIKISRFTKKIVLQNIIFAGVTKALFLLLGALGITGMLLAVFADVGVTLLAILNSLRVLSYKEK